MCSSPFSWFPEYTPVDEWIGGTNDIASGTLANGNKPDVCVTVSLFWFAAETALAEEMQSRGFELLEEADIPLMMREHKVGSGTATIFLTSPTAQIPIHCTSHDDLAKEIDQ